MITLDQRCSKPGLKEHWYKKYKTQHALQTVGIVGPVDALGLSNQQFGEFVVALTDLQIRRTGKPGNYTDGRGLFLQVASTGGKYWRYAYRFGGKQKTLALRYIP